MCLRQPRKKEVPRVSDVILEAWASGLIEIARFRSTPKALDSWTPGKKLKLLIAGYNGARNTGEETRVEEIVRQFRQVLGEQNVLLAVLTLNPEFSRGYYGDAAPGDGDRRFRAIKCICLSYFRHFCTAKFPVMTAW
jgi:hypothetical protein